MHCSDVYMCVILQSLDPEIDAQIKARYRDKFKLDSDSVTSYQQAVRFVASSTCHISNDVVQIGLSELFDFNYFND